MSNLLNEAIVDAKALRASALKNAEASVVDKYSNEVKAALEQLLEQDELADLEIPPVEPEAPMLDPGLDMSEAPLGSEEELTEDEVPLAATDGLAENEGENLSSLPADGEDVEVTIDLGALQEAIDALATTIDEDEEINIEAALDEELDEEVDVDVDPSAEEEEADSKAMSGLANLSEEGDIESIVDAVMEKLDVDTGFELSGWGGRPTSQLKHGQELELAHEASTATESVDEEAELDEELKESKVALESENNALKEQLGKYKHAIEEIKENLYEVNLSNARLLYTNRVLRNTSLNERQKDKIVEAISGAGSVAEAKTIFTTLQSTVEGAPKQRPQSLSEAIGSKGSSVIRATRHESAQPNDAFSDRMRRLAGIK